MLPESSYFVESWRWIALGVILCCCGCGTTKSRQATEQLLLSDAVDRSVAHMDFSVLSGQSVYLDTTYLRTVKGPEFVNADYIISSLRQQIIASRCLLQDARDEADYIIEARVGVLGADEHEVNYGLPASSAVSTAASYVPSAPPIPLIPELSLAKRHDQQAAAKVACFAYHRESRSPIWQSGVYASKSDAKAVWLLGAGPFQGGAIHEGVAFAGRDVKIPGIGKDRDSMRNTPLVDYSKEARFESPVVKPPFPVSVAGHEDEEKKKK